MSYEFTAPRKDPDATLSYQMDWTDYLAEGEEIFQADVLASSDELAISDVTNSATRVTWKASGGAVRQSYLMTVRIETNFGHIDDRSVKLPVRER